jgi:internalin A
MHSVSSTPARPETSHSQPPRQRITKALSNSGITNDTLPELTIPTLKELNISVNEDFSALSLFAGCTGLERIDFSNTIVDYVDTLSAMAQLTHVNGSHTEVEDISPLADLSNLLELRFANCCISTIDKPFHTLYLKTLDLSFNSLTDLIAFENCAVLESVYLGFNQLETAYPISKSVMFLTVLDFSGNMNMDKNDLYFLDEAVNLKELYIDGLSMFDLDDLHNLTKLERLSAMDCSISDLTGLESTVGTLKYLNLSSNSLDDISILAGLQGNGLYLDLSFNFYVTDLSLLSSSAQYAVLNITNERLDLSTIPALQIDTLILAYAKDAEKNGWLQTNPAGAYVVIDCPMDKVVVMETMLGRGNVQFMEEIEDYVNFLGSLGVDVRYMEAAIKSY